jgi:hypothetical protein
MGSGRQGKDFLELVSANARHKVIYPGINSADAKYYSDEFGEITQVKESSGVTKQRFNPLYFQKVNPPSESTKYQEETIARYSPSDIMYHEFGEITYSIIQNGSVQTPGVGLISYIPVELNKIIKQMVDENKWLMTLNYDSNKCRDFNDHGVLYPEIDIETIHQLFDEKMLLLKQEDDDVVQASNAPHYQPPVVETVQRDPEYKPPIPQVDSVSPVPTLNPADIKITDVDNKNGSGVSGNSPIIGDDDLI